MGLLERNDQSSGQKLISKHNFPHGNVSFDDGDEVAPGRLGTVVIFDCATCPAAASVWDVTAFFTSRDAVTFSILSTQECSQQSKQGKKVCKTTAVQCYHCFSLRLLLFLVRRVKWLEKRKKKRATSVSC